MIKSVVGVTSLNCDACGAALTMPEAGQASVVCEFCGTPYQLSVGNSDAFSRASAGFTQCNWADAEKAYLQAASEATSLSQKAAALYGAALSRYGVQYVASPNGRNSIPVSRRTQTIPFVQDQYFQYAVGFADPQQRDSFFKEGTAIDDSIRNYGFNPTFNNTFNRNMGGFNNAQNWTTGQGGFNNAQNWTTGQGGGFNNNQGWNAHQDGEFDNAQGGAMRGVLQGVGTAGAILAKKRIIMTVVSVVIFFVIAIAVVGGVLGSIFGGNGDNKYINGGLAAPPTFAQVSAGWEHSLALDTEGRIWAWGRGDHGRLGTGRTADEMHPRLITVNIQGLATPHYFRQVSAGSSYSLALDNQANIWAFGNFADGRLGLGNSLTTNQLTPQRITQVEDLNGNVICLITDEVNFPIFRQVSAGGGFTSISGQNTISDIAHSLAVCDIGRIWAWGSDRDGRLGRLPTNNNQYSPRQVSDLTGFLEVDAGLEFSIARRHATGFVYTWGSNASGQLGRGGVSGTAAVTPTRIATLTNVTQISATGRHVVALAERNNASYVYTWGDATSGKLGTGAVTGSRNTPFPLLDRQVIGLLATAGVSHSIVWYNHTYFCQNEDRDVFGGMFVLGSQELGRLGNGNSAGVVSQIFVDNDPSWWVRLENIRNISAVNHTLAVCAQGTIYVFGFGTFGRLGLGGTSNQTRPLPITMVNWG